MSQRIRRKRRLAMLQAKAAKEAEPSKPDPATIDDPPPSPAKITGEGGGNVVGYLEDESPAKRSEIQAVQQAINNDWPVSSDVRRLVVTRMALIVGQDPLARSKIAAARVLVSADSVNVQREKIATPQEHVHRLGEPLRVTGIQVEAQDRFIEAEGKATEGQP